MFDGKRILSLIPARGGSKGIPHKNIVPLNNKPLIAWTIEASLNSSFIDDTVITTDDEEIAEVSRKFGGQVPFMRPEYLAGDKARTIDAVVHAVHALSERGRDYDVLVLLQPTSPLRTSQDIDGAIHSFFEHGRAGLASVSPVTDNPILIRTLEPDGTMRHLIDSGSTCRRQDMKAYYRVNGSIYINMISEIDDDLSMNDNPVGFVMSKEHSIDIDELEDIVLAEYYSKKIPALS